MPEALLRKEVYLPTDSRAARAWWQYLLSLVRFVGQVASWCWEGPEVVPVGEGSGGRASLPYAGGSQGSLEDYVIPAASRLWVI